MRRILFSFIVISVLFAFPVTTMAGPNSNGTTHKFFKVNVKSSTGGEQLYCFNFITGGVLEGQLLTDPIGPGNVPLPGDFRWDYAGLFKIRWQAVAVSDPVAFSGTMAFRKLSGNGIDGGGTTYKLKGRQVKESCVPPI
jgi:hypothetical protein